MSYFLNYLVKSDISYFLRLSRKRQDMYNITFSLTLIPYLAENTHCLYYKCQPHISGSVCEVFFFCSSLAKIGKFRKMLVKVHWSLNPTPALVPKSGLCYLQCVFESDTHCPVCSKSRSSVLHTDESSYKYVLRSRTNETFSSYCISPHSRKPAIGHCSMLNLIYTITLCPQYRF